MIWKFGLLGKSLEHSFSPEYFNNKFHFLSLPHSYEKIEVPDLKDIRNIVTKKGLNGFNVTIPYKEEIIPFLDQLTDEAVAVGAVNCVVIKDNNWIGHNTDIGGFEKSILPFLENHYPRALIVGTGGASKAIAYVLESKGITVFYLTRTPQQKNHLGYQDIDASSMMHFPLIVQCTPLGTWPNIDALPNLPYEGLTQQHYLFDLIYNPSETAFLKKGIDKGCQVQNGIRMLEIQADLSWDFWKQHLTTS
jgi:shikimate dehydrogenase